MFGNFMSQLKQSTSSVQTLTPVQQPAPPPPPAPASTTGANSQEIRATPTNMQKVQIFSNDGSGWKLVVDCTTQFNPTKLKMAKKAKWKNEATWQSNIGTMSFGGGQPIVLSADLFFDTTATGEDVRRYTGALQDLTLVDVEAAKALGNLDPKAIKKTIDDAKKAREAPQAALDAWKNSTGKTIQNQITTKQNDLQNAQNALSDSSGIEKLILEGRIRNLQNDINRQRSQYDNTLNALSAPVNAIDKSIAQSEEQLSNMGVGGKGAPPKVKFSWGAFSFISIAASVNVTFTMFLPNGVPVRANCQVKLKQVEEQKMYPPQNPTTRSAARKVWVVEEGQTLDWIAYKEYGNASLWRVIADKNNLDNPRSLRPGQVLKI
jgi:nucleoid-associated protein YgaU